MFIIVTNKIYYYMSIYCTHTSIIEIATIKSASYTHRASASNMIKDKNKQQLNNYNNDKFTH